MRFAVGIGVILRRRAALTHHTGVCDMPGESRLQPIAPDQLPDLLTRLDDGRTTDLALIGSDVWLHALPEDWPEVLQGRVLYRLTGELSGLPRQLLRFDRLQTLTLWLLGLHEEDAAAIAKYLGRLTSLDLSFNLLNLSRNQVGAAGARAIAERLGRLTFLAPTLRRGRRS